MYTPPSARPFLILFCVTAILAGCQKAEDKDSGTFCAGGFVRTDAGVDPVCEGLCQPSLCAHANNVCVDNNCALQCASHADCGAGQDCVPAVEDGTGAKINVCRANGKSSIGMACPDGNECEETKSCNDGTPCSADSDCKNGSCQALTCRTAGVDDVKAYCTNYDCHSDSDCPGGFGCKPVRVGDKVCGGAAPSSSCGKAASACVDPSKNDENGTTYAAGEFCTQRNSCRMRGLCDACATDLDCSLVAGSRCVNGGCATACGSDGDCQTGYQCSSGACVPRSGSCAPAMKGQGELCEPCRADADCGSGMLCSSFVYGGLRSCISAKSIACSSEAECPSNSKGQHAACVEGQCYPAPFNAALNVIACWCQNSGASCSVSTDCCSGQCDDIDSSGLGVCH